MPTADSRDSRSGAFTATRWNSLFRDHEIYVRTGGNVRFLHLSARAQRRAATLALGVVGAWALGTAGLLGWQAWTSWQNRDVAKRVAAIAAAEARVAAEKRTVEEIARTIDARQDQLEALVGAHFGDLEPEVQRGAPPAPPAAVVPQSAVSVDQVARLQAAALRQEAIIGQLGGLVEQRSARVEQVLTTVGIRPRLAPARGGPFIPWIGRRGRAGSAETADPAIRSLARKLDRMTQLESLLDAVPTGLPAERMELSSGFGYRFDPFNGQRALHAGLDFTGAHGSPIRAAAEGRVSFAGVRNGYGNVIEIDHGHGIETRYAHMSGFTARVGDRVRSGEQIGRMGSTGRSTGTHLHFEVRVGGAPVNPRRFLEANAHVLEIKADTAPRRDPGNTPDGVAS